MSGRSANAWATSWWPAAGPCPTWTGSLPVSPGIPLPRGSSRRRRWPGGPPQRRRCATRRRDRMRFRAPTPGDAPAVYELLVARDLADYGVPDITLADIEDE